MVGQTVGHYEVLSRIGEGGMGVVYKARDTHLGRTAAVKVLPPGRTANEDRKRRFIREARLASSLNHPNIVTIYDIGVEGGVDYIAMEFVAGKTLDQLIPRKGMNLTEALRIALQIADALARAHAENIVHRDLKPTNVMVTNDGLVKVLDFGLAKLTETRSADDAETLPMQAGTEEGVILGTVAYMSPEQAEGKEIDTRSDIFAFGSLFYEMVTGQRAFQGETRLSVMSAILRAEPRPVREFAGNVPREVERVITHCMRKEPARRFQHMVDVKTLLEAIKEDSDSGRLTVAALPAGPARRARWPVWAVVVIAAAGLAFWAFRMWSEPSGARSFASLTAQAGLSTQPALSPDGRAVIYASDGEGGGDMGIWRQQVAGSTPALRTREGGQFCQPTFSPDGEHIAYTGIGQNGGIYRMSAYGGPAQLIGPGGAWPTFSPDGRKIAYSVGARFRRSQVYVYDANEGESRPLKLDIPWSYCPAWSPDGKYLLFEGSREAVSTQFSQFDWWIAPAEGGNAVQTGLRRFLEGGKVRPIRDLNPALDSRMIWSPDGKYVVFAAYRSGPSEIWRLRISPRTGEPLGQPEQISAGPANERHPAMTSGGLLVFSSVTMRRDIWYLPLRANEGKIAGPLRQMTHDGAENTTPRLSRDGRSIIYVSDRPGQGRIWIRNLATGVDTPAPLTGASGREYRAIFSPDGSRVAMCRDVEGKGDLVVFNLAEGREDKMCGGVNVALDWSVDGKRILYAPAEPPMVRSIDVESKKITDVVKHSSGAAIRPGALSPDGQWISFQLVLDLEQTPVYVAPLRAGAASPESEWLRIADGPNEDSWWSPNGNLLYYLTRQDGSYCVWARKLDPTAKKPAGDSFAVQHFHGRRHVAGVPSFGHAMTADGMYCSLREVTSTVWRMRLE
ncbi:MAG: PD40 domain-containing protein [Bryobacteraceae bacterium]|nr:PD40 domain-containing protein [Bryobacteraceae bacterium]